MFHHFVQDHHFVPAENKITSIFSKIRKHNTRHGNIKLDDNIKSQIRDLVARKKDGETLKDKLNDYLLSLKAQKKNIEKVLNPAKEKKREWCRRSSIKSKQRRQTCMESAKKLKVKVVVGKKKKVEEHQ